MTYALLIRTADTQLRVAGAGHSYAPGSPMCYAHPSVARRAYAAYRKKFAEYVGLRPVRGYIVSFIDVPAVLAGRKLLPEFIE